ncbi:MAG: hypothetical protein KBG02_14230, partial [Haliscomenobacter sp.]|nr:hypothetical protein [Haliscomenobacter sp.]
ATGAVWVSFFSGGNSPIFVANGLKTARSSIWTQPLKGNQIKLKRQDVRSKLTEVGLSQKTTLCLRHEILFSFFAALGKNRLLRQPHFAPYL